MATSTGRDWGKVGALAGVVGVVVAVLGVVVAILIAVVQYWLSPPGSAQPPRSPSLWHPSRRRRTMGNIYSAEWMSNGTAKRISTSMQCLEKTMRMVGDATPIRISLQESAQTTPVSA